MSRRIFYRLAILAFIQFNLAIALSPPSLAQEWKYRRPRGTLKVVDLYFPSASAMINCAESLVTLDRDNNLVPCLAEDWRWIDERTIEFKLRESVRFHNGERFDAEVVRINWEAYKRMESPRPHRFLVPPDETVFEIIDEYIVRFTFPEPDGLAFVKFLYFFQIAPAFFKEHKFDEGSYGYFPESGPWGTGPFKLVEGGMRFARPSEQFVLGVYEDYWDRRYPKVEKVIFDNTLIGDRNGAMRLCRETEGSVDIINFIRPLDTLKVAKSKYAKVVKSKDVSGFGGDFNQRKRDSKWKDIRLRKALNLAINREELWKFAARGNAYNLDAWPYDTTKARTLLAAAGYREGFEVKIITTEAWGLEVQIIKRMLERIGLKVTFDVLTIPELYRKTYIPLLDKPPEDQDWDISFLGGVDMFGHIGPSFLVWNIEESNKRWIEYDPVYEEMWKDMVRTVDRKAQDEKIRQMQQYLHDHAYSLDIYSPLTLYAVNKDIDFVPMKFGFLRLKETSVTDNHWSVRAEKK